MSLDFSGLGDLAKKGPAKIGAGWVPPTPADFGEGRVLAFDQSLTATGWAKVISEGGTITVTSAGKFSDTHAEEKNSIETQLRRGVDVFERAYLLIDQAKVSGCSLAHESPPNPAAVKGGGYGSLLAAQSIRIAAALAEMNIEMLGAQPAKRLVCGNANAKKTEAHAALKEHCFLWIRGSEHVTNEATRDALMVALLWLYRRKK